ncbi:DUF3667 domain-containing protein [Myroides odoratimimus]|uniref:DUF3667 domain-containing protein n=1 Tax=Myroides odoratimimus TaxID=76832 RepID=UPI002575B439|nr:DUF3667 domain-containing protein [Myroides odoratimimus]MDM1395865.1 DUF3667 domain-containing protein [Myroides odoratimimus]
MSCKTSHTDLSTGYCPDCGESIKLKRIDSHYVLHEISHVLHVEKGIFYTIKELLLKPGITVQKFITEDRSKLVKPIIFIIIASLIYSLIAHYFHIESFVSYHHSGGGGVADSIFLWGDTHSGYMNIIIGVFIAVWAKVLFKKHYFNLFEILILLCFVTGMSMLIFSVFAIIQGIVKVNLMAIAGVVGVLYCTWGIGQFFEVRSIKSYLKAFFAYVLGMLTFSVLVIIIGELLDYVILQSK